MDKEIKNEVRGLLKQGIPEPIAIITACANKGKPELAAEHLEEMADEQAEIKEMMEKLGMVPLQVSYNIPLTIEPPEPPRDESQGEK